MVQLGIQIWCYFVGEGSKTWHYYWFCDVLKDGGRLAWLSSERSYQLTETKQIPLPNHWTDARDPYGWIRERVEEGEGEGDPTGRRVVSPNPDHRELSETELLTRSIHKQVRGPQHKYSRGLPCQASVGEDALNPQETWGPRTWGGPRWC